MFEEPSGYEDEPREYFQDLPAKLSHLLYHYERLSHDLSAELNYYHQQLQDRCSRLLELGCGTGLLSTKLQRMGYQVTGMDIDRRALIYLAEMQMYRLAQMDMRALGFSQGFEAVLIGQNTLNLLADPTEIRSCLKEVYRVLVDSGLLLAHLHCTEPDQVNRLDDRLLQFHIFDHPEGGKIIKETIRHYDKKHRRLNLEQRFKIRRFRRKLPDHNYRHLLSLVALSREQWIELVESAGFVIESWVHGFQKSTPASRSTLHLVARKFAPR
ncbi:MAG: class I SAM-dependent methyltransferase [Desulfofustis sp.]|nr:class I SAM-dependent methyltransferase [Desulfofustis sp.]